MSQPAASPNSLRVRALAFTLLAATLPAFASDVPGIGDLSLVIENDSYYQSDRHYTSGVAIVFAPPAEQTPGWASRLARRLPWMPGEGSVRLEYLLGQSLYTPRDTSVEDPAPEERPYAGWLHGTIGLFVEDHRRLDQISLTLGVVGPGSYGEESQTVVHQIRDFEEPQGWDTQLSNELGVALTGQRSWPRLAARRLAGLDFDLAPHVGGSVGNVLMDFAVGGTARYGRNLPLDHGPPRIQPGVRGSGRAETADGFGWYLFAGVEGRAIARNLFLDGNTFRESRSVDREILVGDFQWGAMLAWRRARFGYTHVVRTREFETQGVHDRYGSLVLSLAF